MPAVAQKVFRFEGFTLDLTRRSLRAGDRVVELRPKSFDVLAYLVERAGRPAGKDEIIQAVWPDVTVTEESLTRCVSDIRLALDDGAQRIIKTLPRRGYVLAAPVTGTARQLGDLARSTRSRIPLHRRTTGRRSPSWRSRTSPAIQASSISATASPTTSSPSCRGSPA